ncbi:ETC complex I subunit [Hephaestia sp. GCM10023244]|uniref:ETC complex I subunit n=1 Tax=unclassified Hephaestia TaxID=2631281 RepID=UPI0020778AD6|nr:ETC complex I subunit [Hephaestia sp. MAHUQ-44]MCM8731879.1 ETC complex I subunit [Hephaestia sp. MAHUQ-44]
MPSVRIYQRPKNAMQSGKFRTDSWVVEFEPAEAKRPDPLTGWAGSGDTREQVLMSFASLEAAKAYADREGLPFTVTPAPTRTLKLQAYADNFR